MTQENESRFQATMVVADNTNGITCVQVTEKGKTIATVTFGETHTTIVLEKAYTNWSRQVVRLARDTAGV